MFTLTMGVVQHLNRPEKVSEEWLDVVKLNWMLESPQNIVDKFVQFCCITGIYSDNSFWADLFFL